MIRLPKTSYTLATIITVCILAGCSFPGAQRSPSRQTWLLQGDEGIQTSHTINARSCITLRVSVPESASGFSTPNMMYSKKPDQLAHFAYHQWVDAPARMLAASMQSRIENSGLFGAVVSGSTDVKTDFRLDSELSGPLQVFESGKSIVILTMKLKLIDISKRRLLNTQSFSYSEPASEANPQAGVAAANRATQHLLDDLTTFVSDSFKDVDC
jgi:cholesterol transport system auxiliary component